MTVTVNAVAGDGPMVWTPEPLTVSQRAGQACVYCSKVWPRPRIRAGVLGEATEAEPGLFDATAAGAEELGAAGSPLYACEDCGPLVRTSP